jgi:hypothetical protein
MNTDVHITRHGAQINCGVLPLYLTYDLEQGKSEISEDYVVFVIPDLRVSGSLCKYRNRIRELRYTLDEIF